MNTTTFEMLEQRFLKVELHEVRQKGVAFYVGCIAANDLIECYTVEPAEYDQAQEATAVSRFRDDSELFEFRRHNRQDRAAKKAFQRKESQRRLREISKWLNEEEYALFPNTLIATCDLANDFLDLQEGDTFNSIVDADDLNPSEMKTCLLLEEDGAHYLYIPLKKGTLLIIDGQHRLKGLQEASSQTREDYNLLVGFILGYDRSVIAQLFYTINYTQKSVNKSLLYQLTGEFSYELDEITFLHEVVRLLNEVDRSPLFNRVKMLGTVPVEADKETRLLMTVSQAFIIEYLLPLIVNRARSARSHPPIFLYYYSDKEKQIEIPRFLIRYFQAIESLVGDQWLRPSDFMISKTVALGALLRLLPAVYLSAVYHREQDSPDQIEDIDQSEIEEILQGIETIDTSTDGPYGKNSSEGTVRNLSTAFANAAPSLANFGPGDDAYEQCREKFFSWMDKSL